jgi:putative phosphoesterase
MKILIASDLHGDADCCAALLAKFQEEGAEELVLLGDLLYHGPRNDLPQGYRPKEVIAMLSALSPAPLCVRGNCEAEVDQMVLPFPVMAEYAQFMWDGIPVFATHGHHHNPEHLPPLRKGAAFLYGHTHLYEARKNEEGVLLLNPGSVSLPKGGNPKSYAVYENGRFTVKDFEGNVLVEEIR